MNIDLQIGAPFTVRTSATLTSGYVAGKVFSMANHNAIGLEVNYTNGDETSLELKIEVSNDGGLTYSRGVGESTTTGTVTVSLAERKFTATGIYSILVNPVRGKLVKVSVKATTGTPTGTVAVRAIPLWV